MFIINKASKFKKKSGLRVYICLSNGVKCSIPYANLFRMIAVKSILNATNCVQILLTAVHDPCHSLDKVKLVGSDSETVRHK